MSPTTNNDENTNENENNSGNENQDNSDDNNQNNSGNENQDENNDSEPTLEELVAAKVSDELKVIKGKLDKAYAERDSANSKATELEREKQEEHRARLEEEGKYKELYQEGLAEERTKREAADRRTEEAERRNVELTRDVSIKAALSGYSFRNEKASEMAHAEIVKTLVKDETGAWSQAGGGTIAAAVKLFAEHESNSFLLKPKVSSGGGSSDSRSSANQNDGKSLFDLPQSEVLKRAAEGKLRK